jgi:hypothetical protein
MHEARVIDSKRGWMVFGGVLLIAVIALSVLLRERRNAAIAASMAAMESAAASSPPAESATESAGEVARRAAIAAQGPIKHKGINAADSYKEAMGLYAGLTDDEKTMLSHWRDKGDPKAAAALYAKIQPIMDLLRSARKADYADWGLGPMNLQENSNIMARYNSIRDLASLAFWESNYRFQSDPDGAVSDLAATDAMGRSGDDSLIGLLVEYGVHFGGMNVLAQNAGAITSSAGPDLADIVNPAAAEQTFQSGLNGEASMLQALLDEYANPATRNQAETYFSQGLKLMNGPNASISPAEAVSEMQWLLQTEQALGGSLQEPDAQFQQWWTQKQAEAASMPLANTGLGSLEDVRTLAEGSVVESAMLAAGMALEQNDQAQFQSIIDPASGQPFTYTQTATGFQLGSALMKHNGRPVSLSFPAPAAK